MLRTTTALVCLLLYGVWQPAAGQFVPQETKPKPMVRAPSLLPGCLLPKPGLIAATAPVEIDVSLAVSSEGRVETAELKRTSGNAELDTAFIQAAIKCSFQAATQEGAPIKHLYSLKFQWPSKSEPQGLSLCFMPDYPLAALRTEAQGSVEVAFKVSEENTEPEIRLAKATNSRSLNIETVRSAKACLQHPAVKSSLLPNTWYSQVVTWRLE